jgi:CAAX prenyl protease-like protein
MPSIETGSSSPDTPHPNPLPKGEGAKLARELGTARDDLAYFLPMAVFLVFTWAGDHWPAFYVSSYVLKTIATAMLLIAFRRHYTKISWDYWWLGALLGIIGVVQWVGMEKGLLHLWPNYPRLEVQALDPTRHFSSAAALWSFVAVRWAGAALVVPVMEELFWRDFLWRTIAAPADFRLAAIGEWDRGIPLIVVTLLFCSVHVEWMTAIVWGLMIGSLLLYTRSLGACIIMHAVTNLLLGAYVLHTHDWMFW